MTPQTATEYDKQRREETLKILDNDPDLFYTVISRDRMADMIKRHLLRRTPTYDEVSKIGYMIIEDCLSMMTERLYRIRQNNMEYWTDDEKAADRNRYLAELETFSEQNERCNRGT